CPERGHYRARVLRQRQAEAGGDVPAVPERPVLRLSDPGRDGARVRRGRTLAAGERVRRRRAERGAARPAQEREGGERGDLRQRRAPEAALLGERREPPAGGGILRGRLTEVGVAVPFEGGASGEGNLPARHALRRAQPAACGHLIRRTATTIRVSWR